MKLHQVSAQFKSCNRCQLALPTERFSRDARNADGLQGRCKGCCNTLRGAARAGDPFTAVKDAARNRARYLANPDAVKARSKAWRLKNIDRARALAAARTARRRKTHGESIKASNRKHMAQPIRRIGRQIWGLLRGAKAHSATTELVGYKAEELRQHLEAQFTKGMSWDNYGQWHVDHIIPLSSFTITGPGDPELKRAWGLPNLRPLWAKENLTKSNKLVALL